MLQIDHVLSKLNNIDCQKEQKRKGAIFVVLASSMLPKETETAATNFKFDP